MSHNKADFKFTFEKLDVWHKAKAFALSIYKQTEHFPSEEKFGLISQLRRAAISIASNLAEGSGRQSKKDQAHFTQIAYSSLMEVLCQIDIAADLNFINTNELELLREKARELSTMLSALYRAQSK